MTEYLPDDIDAPDWTNGGRVHNWKNYINDELQRLWPTFTHEQKAAIYRNATEAADNENWD